MEIWVKDFIALCQLSWLPVGYSTFAPWVLWNPAVVLRLELCWSRVTVRVMRQYDLPFEQMGGGFSIVFLEWLTSLSAQILYLLIITVINDFYKFIFNKITQCY